MTPHEQACRFAEAALTALIPNPGINMDQCVLISWEYSDMMMAQALRREAAMEEAEEVAERPYPDCLKGCRKSFDGDIEMHSIGCPNEAINAGHAAAALPPGLMTQEQYHDRKANEEGGISFRGTMEELKKNSEIIRTALLPTQPA